MQVGCDVFAKSLYQFRLFSHSDDFSGTGIKKIIEYLVIFLIPVPEKSSQKGLLLLSAAGGAAGTGILDFLQVANDLGSAFLNGFAVGTHNKAA